EQRPCAGDGLAGDPADLFLEERGHPPDRRRVRRHAGAESRRQVLPVDDQPDHERPVPAERRVRPDRAELVRSRRGSGADEYQGEETEPARPHALMLRWTAPFWIRPARAGSPDLTAGLAH